MNELLAITQRHIADEYHVTTTVLFKYYYSVYSPCKVLAHGNLQFCSLRCETSQCSAFSQLRISISVHKCSSCLLFADPPQKYSFHHQPSLLFMCLLPRCIHACLSWFVFMNREKHLSY